MRKVILSIMLFVGILSVNAQYRDVKLPEKPAQKGYNDYTFKDDGFWFAVEAEGGSSIMSVKTNMQYAQVTGTVGYRLNEFLRFGVGVGGRMYVHNADVRNTDNKFGVPIFANIRGNFISAYDIDGVPFWSLNIGGITEEGFFASPTIGYSFGGLRNNFLKGLSYTISNFKDCTQSRVSYSYFALKLGYEF